MPSTVDEGAFLGSGVWETISRNLLDLVVLTVDEGAFLASVVQKTDPTNFLDLISVNVPELTVLTVDVGAVRGSVAVSKDLVDLVVLWLDTEDHLIWWYWNRKWRQLQVLWERRRRRRLLKLPRVVGRKIMVFFVPRRFQWLGTFGGKICLQLSEYETGKLRSSVQKN